MQPDHAPLGLQLPTSPLSVVTRPTCEAGRGMVRGYDWPVFRRLLWE